MKTLSRSQVIEMIDEGKVIVIYQGYALNLTNWMPYHPGGEKAMLHMVGRDATDEMIAYHSPQTVESFLKYKIGKVENWENLLPPIQGGLYRQRSTRGDETLDAKLDTKNSSDEGSIISNDSEDDITDRDMKVQPKVPQNILITDENKDTLFPLYKNQTIVNPKILMDKYDNELTQQDLSTIPKLDYKTQQYLRGEYDKLHAEIIRQNFYQCDYWNYIREIIKLASMFLYSMSFFKLGYYKISAVILGLTWQQGTFIAHDAGHLSITHNYYFDNIFGFLIADFFGGLSLGWWKKNHNVHHLVTNDPIHDPDIQHLPFFAVSTRLFNDVYSTYYDTFLKFDSFAKILIPFQKYMYYIILSFGRFNLYVLSWGYLIRGESPKKGKASWFRYFEIIGLSFFAYWYFYKLIYCSLPTNNDKFSFMMISNISSFIVHVQITLSHFAMSTSDLGVSESFPLRQIRTTMDVDCPKWLDFFHGGLQFQAIHHLFPRLPRHNLRNVQPLVIKFCEKVGLKYSIYGFGEGNEVVISKLGDIGKQCSIMLDAAKKFSHEDITP